MKVSVKYVRFFCMAFVCFGLLPVSLLSQEQRWKGASVDFKHGRLKVSANHRFLEHADGTPFFYLGDTAWELFHRLDEAEVETYLENRRSKGFTVIQAVVLAELDGLNAPNRNGDRPLVKNDPLQPDERYFAWVDKVIRMAEAKGLYIGLLPTWGDKVDRVWGVGPKIFTAENAYRYGKWLGERYRDFPNIIWINGGDRMGGGKNYPVWDALGKGLRQADPNHLITFHPQGECSSSHWFHACDWLDFNMAQTGHCQKTYEIYERLIVADYNRTPVKPCLDGEPRYENHPVCWKPDELGWFDETDVRKAMYWNLFSGALGHTYGCHDIWQMKSGEREPVGLARGDWRTSLDLPGAFDLIYARKLMEAFDWHSREPAPELIVSENNSFEHRIVALKGNGYALVYFPEGQKAELDLRPVSEKKKLKAKWLNPRDGKTIKAKAVSSAASSLVIPPTSGKGNDWVLVIEE